MAKRNVCILESFLSFGATDEGRWQRSWNIAALMLLIRDRSRAFAVCLCLLKPVSLGFLRRFLFLLRVALLSNCFISRGFSTNILLWYSRASRVKSWRAMNRTRFSEIFWICFFKPRKRTFCSVQTKACRAVCQPQWNWPLSSKTSECVLKEDPTYSAMAYIHV